MPNKSKENWFIKEYFYENSSELPEKSIVQFECQICDVCHLSSSISKGNWYIKGCALQKKIMHDLFFMKDFIKDSSELQERPDLWCVPFIIKQIQRKIFIKGCALLKNIIFDLLIINDFNEDSSELPEKSIVQFRSKPNTQVSCLGITK